MPYYVAYTDIIDPEIHSKEWEKAETGLVDQEPKRTEGRFPAPETCFKLLRGPEGLSVWMHSAERELRAVEEENGAVYCDSCMEFFYKPSPWDTRYLNFEVNPKGVMHLGIGDSRFHRVMLWQREAMNIQTEVTDCGWTVKYYIPDSLIREWYPDLETLSRGNRSRVARANFYKCGNLTKHPHHAAWSAIDTEMVDFHIPDFFGQLIFS